MDLNSTRTAANTITPAEKPKTYGDTLHDFFVENRSQFEPSGITPEGLAKKAYETHGAASGKDYDSWANDVGLGDFVPRTQSRLAELKAKDEWDAAKPEDRGSLAGTGAALGRGAMSAVGAVGQTMGLADLTPASIDTDKGYLDRAGESLVKWSEDKKANTQFMRPTVAEETDANGFVKKSWEGGVESIVTSAAPMAAGYAGMKAGAAAGAAFGPVGMGIGGTIGGLGAYGLARFGMFGAGVYGDTYDKTYAELKQKNPDMAEEEVRRVANKGAWTDAISENVSEAVGDAAAFYTFGGTKLLQQPLKATIKDVMKRGIKGVAGDVAKQMPFEVGSEVANAAVGAQWRQEAGLDGGDMQTAMVDAIGPAVVMSLLMGGGVAGYTEVKARKALNDINSADPNVRAKTATEITGQILERTKDEELAQTWNREAFASIEAAEPIQIDEQLAKFGANKARIDAVDNGEDVVVIPDESEVAEAAAVEAPLSPAETLLTDGVKTTPEAVLMGTDSPSAILEQETQDSSQTVGTMQEEKAPEIKVGALDTNVPEQDLAAPSPATDADAPRAKIERRILELNDEINSLSKGRGAGTKKRVAAMQEAKKEQRRLYDELTLMDQGGQAVDTSAQVTAELPASSQAVGNIPVEQAQQVQAADTAADLEYAKNFDAELVSRRAEIVKAEAKARARVANLEELGEKASPKQKQNLATERRLLQDAQAELDAIDRAGASDMAAQAEARGVEEFAPAGIAQGKENAGTFTNPTDKENLSVAEQPLTTTPVVGQNAKPVATEEGLLQGAEAQSVGSLATSDKNSVANGQAAPTVKESLSVSPEKLTREELLREHAAIRAKFLRGGLTTDEHVRLSERDSFLRREAFSRFGIESLDTESSQFVPKRSSQEIQKEIDELQVRVDKINAGRVGAFSGGTRAKTTTANANTGKLLDNIAALKRELAESTTPPISEPPTLPAEQRTQERPSTGILGQSQPQTWREVGAIVDLLNKEGGMRLSPKAAKDISNRLGISERDTKAAFNVFMGDIDGPSRAVPNINIPEELSGKSKPDQEPVAQKSQEKGENNQGLDGYVSTITDKMSAGRIKKKLSERISYKGKAMTRAEYVEAKLGEGYEPATRQEPKVKEMSRMASFRANNEQQRAHEKKMREAGNKTVYSLDKKDEGVSVDVTKIEHDYAVWVSSPAATATPVQEKAEAPAPKQDAATIAKEKAAARRAFSDQYEDKQARIMAGNIAMADIDMIKANFRAGVLSDQKLFVKILDAASEAGIITREERNEISMEILKFVKDLKKITPKNEAHDRRVKRLSEIGHTGRQFWRELDEIVTEDKLTADQKRQLEIDARAVISNAEMEANKKTPTPQWVQINRDKTVEATIPEAQKEKLTLKQQKAWLLAEIDKAMKSGAKGGKPFEFHVPNDGHFRVKPENLAAFKEAVVARFLEKERPSAIGKNPPRPAQNSKGRVAEGEYYNEWSDHNQPLEPALHKHDKGINLPYWDTDLNVLVDGHILVQLDAKPNVKGLKSKGDKGVTASPIEDLMKSFDKTLNNDAELVGVFKSMGEDKKGEDTESNPVILAHVRNKFNGKDAIFGAKKVDAVRTIHPDAKLKVDKDGAQLGFYKNGRLVAVVLGYTQSPEFTDYHKARMEEIAAKKEGRTPKLTAADTPVETKPLTKDEQDGVDLLVGLATGEAPKQGAPKSDAEQAKDFARANVDNARRAYEKWNEIREEHIKTDRKERQEASRYIRNYVAENGADPEIKDVAGRFKMSEEEVDSMIRSEGITAWGIGGPARNGVKFAMGSESHSDKVRFVLGLVKSGELKGLLGEAKKEAVEKKPEAQAKPQSILDRQADAINNARAGKVNLDQFKASFTEIVENEKAVKAELNALTKDQLLSMLPSMTAYRMKSEKKAAIVDAVYESGTRVFALGRSFGPSSYVLSGPNSTKKYEQDRLNALKELVANTTEEDIKAYSGQFKQDREELAAKVEGRKEAIANPKTLDDFRSFISFQVKNESKSVEEARLVLSPEQRAEFDRLLSVESMSKRKGDKDAARTSVSAAGQQTGGEIIATKHTQKGHDLFVVRLEDSVSREDYMTLLSGAKKLGGYYSKFRGNGAIPGFQFTDREQAQAFLALAKGDTATAQEAVKERRDAFEDDRSQTVAQRLTTMAERLEEQSEEILNADRKANTARRARQAASAEGHAHGLAALGKTMRNLAKALEEGTAQILSKVRQKTQVEMLSTDLRTAKYEELRAKYPAYVDMERHKGEPPTMETADYATFPTYTLYRSDWAELGRQLLEHDGFKTLGKRIMAVADDVSDAYLKFAKENRLRVSAFSKQGGGIAVYASKPEAERVIQRSGYRGRAIVLPFKRGENYIILSPSEAMKHGIWQGDGDTKITLKGDFVDELIAKLGGRKAKRETGISIPWQLETTHTKRKALARMGIEAAYEYRAALREFLSLAVAPAKADKIKELERSMVGRANDGLDFFPTPQSIADEMVMVAEIEPGMSVLEPSAGMGHIAERIREAGVDPDVAEMSNSRRELLEAKGFYVVGGDFMDMNPRGFTYGDVFRDKDGVEGIMRGSGGMGSGRVGFIPLGKDERQMEWKDREDLEGVRKSGANSGYDRIIMNPPFSNRRDVEHVRRAYDLLKPGGRLVAIMGEGSFFGQDKKAQEFRDWLDSVGGTSEKLPEGSFQDPTLPVNTGVNARMVVIEKDGDGGGPLYQATGDGAPVKQTSGGRGTREQVTPPIIDLRAAFPWADSITEQDGRTVVTKGKVSFAVTQVETISPNEVSFQLAYGRKPGAQDQIAGEYRASEIRLSKVADKWTVQHEYEHFLEDMGLITKFEQAVLDAAVRKAEKDGTLKFSPGTGKDRMKPAELRAYYVQHELAARDFQRKTTLGRVLQKVADFIDALANLFVRTSRGIVRDVESGAMMGRPTAEQRKFMMPMLQAAYHGSPHRFDKFTLDAMGTGEGAQAYGWGLYFAGKKEVAEYYREKLTDKVDTLIDGVPIREALYEFEFDSEIERMALESLIENDGNIDIAIERQENTAKIPGNPKEWNDEFLSIAAQLKEWKHYGLVTTRKEAGQLYKVDIPEDSVMLHWDKPLSEQPEKVREALGALIDKYDGVEISDLNTREDYLALLAHDLKALPSMKGDRIYHMLKEAFLQDKVASGYASESRTDKAASEYLNSLGIKGIKYLDGTSRNQGEGSYNYVIFDDSAIEVLETYYQVAQNPQYALAPTLQKAKELTSDIMHRPEVFGRFKWINTQLHKALRQPAFKRIFDRFHAAAGTQSRSAARAAGLAKDILPDYAGNAAQTVKRLFSRTTDVTREDLRSVSKIMSMETLAGKTASPFAGHRLTDVKRADYNTDAEYQAALNGTEMGALLRGEAITLGGSEITMTAKQIDLYRQARSALDQMLGEMATSEAWKVMRGVLPDHLRGYWEVFANSPAEAQAAMEQMLATELLHAQARVTQAEQAAHAISGSDDMDGFKAYGKALVKLNKAIDNKDKFSKKQLEDGDLDEIVAKREARIEKLADELGIDASDAEERLKEYKAALKEFNDATQHVLNVKDSQKKISDVFDKAGKLIKAGYAPLSRFGKYRIDVHNDEGNLIHATFYDSSTEAYRARRELVANFTDHPDGATVGEVTPVSQEDWTLYQGANPEALRLFAQNAGAESGEAIQAYYQDAVSSRSSLKHLINRKGYAGYSDDLQRILASFVTSGAKRVSANYHAAELQDMVSDKELAPDLRDEAINLKKFIDNPGDAGSGFRAFAANWYMLGSMMSAVWNGTQVMTSTLPELYKHSGSVTRSTKDIGKAYKSIILKHADLTPSEKAALNKAMEDGTVDAAEIHHLYAQASKRFIASLGDGAVAEKAGAVLRLWGMPFAWFETINRKASFLAAYRMAEAQGMDVDEAYEFAKQIVDISQGIYQKHNRPNVARSAAGGAILTFMQYKIMTLEQIARNAKEGGQARKAAALQLAIIMAMGGWTALPLAEDIMDIFDAIMQVLGGKAWLTKKQMREAIEKGSKGAAGLLLEKQSADAVGNVMADFMNIGIVSTVLPVNVAGRAGFGNVVPLVKLLKPSTQYRDSEVFEALGVPGSMAQSLVDASGMLLKGDVGSAAMRLAPNALAAVAKGVDIGLTGEIKNTRGKKITDGSPLDAAVQVIGGQPSRKAEINGRLRENQELKFLTQQTEKSIVSQWADAYEAKGVVAQREALVAVRKRIADWNETNPNWPIVVKQSQVMSELKNRKKTTVQLASKSAPKELRRSMAVE